MHWYLLSARARPSSPPTSIVRNASTGSGALVVVTVTVFSVSGLPHVQARRSGLSVAAPSPAPAVRSGASVASSASVHGSAASQLTASEAAEVSSPPPQADSAATATASTAACAVLLSFIPILCRRWPNAGATVALAEVRRAASAATRGGSQPRPGAVYTLWWIPRGAHPVNSPRAGRQQGSTGSAGCAGSPIFRIPDPRCR